MALNITDAHGPHVAEGTPDIYLLAGEFAKLYRPYHYYISIGVCFFGIASNALNIFVLQRPELRTPTNAFLTAIAACDIFLMADYLVVALHSPNSMDKAVMCRQTYTGALIHLAHANLSVTLYGISTWLTVVLAGLRCVIIKSTGRAYDTYQTVYILVAAVVVAVMTSCIPNYISQGIESSPYALMVCMREMNVTDRRAIPMVGPSAFSLRHRNAPLRVAYWVSGILFKIVPCLLLTVFMGVLIVVLFQTQRRRTRLFRPDRWAADGISNMPVARVPDGADGPDGGALLELRQPAVIPDNLHDNRNTTLTSVKRSITFTTPSPTTEARMVNAVVTTDCDTFTCGPVNCQRRSERLGSFCVVRSRMMLLLLRSRSLFVQPLGVGRVEHVLTQTGDGTTRRANVAARRDCHFAYRITLILVGILFIFLLTQGPQGLCLIMTGILDTDFRRNFYNNVADLSELLSLINCSVNFVLYCSMSSQYRHGCWQLICDAYRECIGLLERVIEVVCSKLKPNQCGAGKNNAAKCQASCFCCKCLCYRRSAHNDYSLHAGTDQNKLRRCGLQLCCCGCRLDKAEDGDACAGDACQGAYNELNNCQDGAAASRQQGQLTIQSAVLPSTSRCHNTPDVFVTSPQREAACGWVVQQANNSDHLILKSVDGQRSSAVTFRGGRLETCAEASHEGGSQDTSDKEESSKLLP